MPDPKKSGSIRRDAGRSAAESRLAAFFSLRAAHADLKARLRRPQLHLGHRYRDLSVFTRLIQLELEHLAGGTTLSGHGPAGAPDSNGAGEATGGGDQDWAHPWGAAVRLELHTVMRRHSARRERLGRLLTPETRAKAAAAAEQRYRAIALSVPWKASGSLATVLGDSIPPPTPAKRAPPPTPVKSLPPPVPAMASAMHVPPEPPPSPRRARGRWYGPVAIAVLVSLALLAALVASGRQPVDPDAGPGLQAGAEATLRAAVAPAFERVDALVQSMPTTAVATGGREQREPLPREQSRNRDVTPPTGEGEPEPAAPGAAVPSSAPTPAAPAPASAEPAPAPVPAPEPPQPVAKDPPEFGFEH